MAMQIPMWLLGRHVTVCKVSGMTASVDGVLSIATSSAVSTVRLRTGWDLQINPQSEDINDDGSVWANNVTLSDDFTFSLEVIPTRDSGEPFKLNDLINAYEWFEVETTFTKGSGTKTLKVRGKRGDIGINSNGRGAFKEALNLMCIDTGSGADAPLVWS